MAKKFLGYKAGNSPEELIGAIMSEFEAAGFFDDDDDEEDEEWEDVYPEDHEED